MALERLQLEDGSLLLLETSDHLLLESSTPTTTTSISDLVEVGDPTGIEVHSSRTTLGTLIG